jgi:hypothetical protein
MLPAHLIDRAADLIAPSKAAGVQADA